MAVLNFQDLEVWKLSKELAAHIYRCKASFPPEEKFGLSHQLRRAAVSVMSNIAEGSGRRSTQEYMRFINIASGSVCELEAQILPAVDLGFTHNTEGDEVLQKADRISKMLYSLHQSLANKVAA